MNIGIDIRKLHDYGIGTHIRNVVLPAARQASSHRFFLYCDPQDQTADNGNLVWVPEPTSKYSLREHFALARKAAEQRVDLFHSPHYTLPLRLNCKCIVTIHDLIHLKFPQYFPYWKVKAAEFVLKKAIAKADTVLTVSHTSKEDILSFFPSAAGRVEVLYNRLSEEWLAPPPPIDLGALGVDDDFLLYVGNFKRHKGIDTLLLAYSKLKAPPPLILVGNRGMDSELSEKIFSTPRVRVFGFAEGTLLRNLYAEAMLFVFPSLYEGFGYPPLEAMCSGTPVLSSDAPAMREILSGGAEFFARGDAQDLADKLAMLIQSSEKRAALTKAGRQQAKLFTSEDSPRRLLEIYQRLLP